MAKIRRWPMTIGRQDSRGSEAGYATTTGAPSQGTKSRQKKVMNKESLAVLGWPSHWPSSTCLPCPATARVNPAWPDVALRLHPDSDGHHFHLADLRGKIVVLDFWASSCPPCVEEAAPLNAPQQRIAGRAPPSWELARTTNSLRISKFLTEHQSISHLSRHHRRRFRSAT